MKPEEIKVDSDVQRHYNETHAKSIAKDYDPDAFGLGHVSKRTDGFYYVLDGQHRNAAAVISGHGHIPVLYRVYKGLSKEEEAKKFILLNQKKKAVSPLDLFRLNVQAQNPVHLEITRIVESFGLRVAAYRREGGIAAVGALINIYHGKVGNKPSKLLAPMPLPQGQLLSRTLNILTKAWRRERDAFDATLLNGMAAILHKHGAEIDAQRMATALSKIGTPTATIGKIRSLQELTRKSMQQAALEQLELIYTRGLKGKALKLSKEHAE